MASRSNAFYNDPNLGAAFSNLAEMFKPPSAQEAYAYTKMKAAKEEASRLAEMYSVAKDPNTPRETIDRLGIAAGRFNPNSSFYSVDQGNATSRANNSANNARSLEETIMQGRFAMERQNAQGVTLSEGQTFVPSPAQRQVGFEPAQGGVTLNQGQTFNPSPVVGGAPLAGAPKPMSLDEVKANELQQQRSSGGITDEVMRNIIFGSTPIEAVQTPDGPRNVGRLDAIGQQPAPSASAAAPKTISYSGPGGARGTARLQPDGSFVDTQTGDPIPAGAVEIRAQGSASDVGLAPTTANQSAANAQSATMQGTLNVIDRYENLLKADPSIVGLPAFLRGTAQDLVATGNALGQTLNRDGQGIVNDITQRMQAGARDTVGVDMFNPNIPAAQFLQHVLAYKLAQTENPAGEVSRQAFERARESLGGGMLSTPQRVLPILSQFRGTLQGNLKGIETLRNPGANQITPEQIGGAPVAPPAADPIAKARAAIAAGAPRAAVLQRLQQSGIAAPPDL